MRFLVFVFAVFFWGQWASAIVISGIYSGACERRLGVILGVDSYSLKFLNLSGKLESLPRHQVIQMVSYASDEIPFASPQIAKIASEQVPAFRITTLKNLSEYPLVTGYPINFTDEKIAFLTQSGREVLIDKKSILSIGLAEDFVLEPQPLKRLPPKFVHAYAFARCEATNAEAGAVLIYPEQILAEPLTIKRDLDRLQKGFALVARYMDEQDFYPQPIVYPAQTRLGMWASFGSRHGMSSSRNNNFTPVLNSGYVSDVYDFQRTIVTGSQPNFLFEHEEAQTQAFYAFKASYFHLAAYLDPSLMLVGENARWSAADMRTSDMRLFSTSGMGFGFDRNNWQFGFMGGSLNLGLQSGGRFYEGTASLSKLHLVWSDYRHRFELLSGGGEASNFSPTNFTNVKIGHLRFNYERTLTEQLHAGFSLIQTTAKLQDSTAGIEMTAKIQSVSALIQYSFAKRFSVDSLLSFENVSVTDPAGLQNTRLGIKGGSSLHLFF
jgi:hypothetical protein